MAKYNDVTKGQEEALLNKIGGIPGMMKVLSGEWVVGTPQSVTPIKKSVLRGASKTVLAGLLEVVGEPTNLEAHERFVARDKWVVDRNGELPISYLSPNIQNNFLDLVEENVPRVVAKQRKLLKGSIDAPILSAIGDKDLDKIEKAKVAFAHVFDFLKTADRTKWYVFYVADANGIVCAVRAYWSGGGWDVDASSVRDTGEWGAGFRVVSR